MFSSGAVSFGMQDEFPAISTVDGENVNSVHLLFFFLTH